MNQIQSNAIKGDSIKGENFRKIQNELIIFPYITIIERAINRENLRKFKNKFFPFNGVRLYFNPYVPSVKPAGSVGLPPSALIFLGSGDQVNELGVSKKASDIKIVIGIQRNHFATIEL